MYVTIYLQILSVNGCKQKSRKGSLLNLMYLMYLSKNVLRMTSMRMTIA